MTGHWAGGEWLAAVAGMMVGVGSAAVLRRGSYRRGPDLQHRQPGGLWLLPVLLAAVWGGLVWRLGAAQPAALPAYLLFTAAGAALSWVDLDVQRLPDRLLLPATAVTGSLLVAAAYHSGQWPSLGRAVLAAAVLAAGYLAVALVATLGLGDVKLAVLVGLVTGWVSWDAVYVATMAACVLFTLARIGAGLARHSRFQAPGAFAPAMVAGAVLALLSH